MSATKNRYTVLLSVASRFVGVGGEDIGTVGPDARLRGLNREVHKIEYWLDSGHDWKTSGERVDEEQTARHLALQKKFDPSLAKLPTEPETAEATQVALGRMLARDDGFIDLTRGSVDLPRFGSNVAEFSDAILPKGAPVLIPFQCACASETLSTPAFYAALRAIAQFDGKDVPIQVCDVKHIDLCGESILSVGGAHRVDAGGQPTVRAREEGRVLPFPRYAVELPSGTARWEFTPDAAGNAQWGAARPNEAFVYVDRVTGREYRIQFGRLADGPFTGLGRLSGFLTIYTEWNQEEDGPLTVDALIKGAEGRPTPNDPAIAAFLVAQKEINTPVETIQRILEAVKFCGDDTLTELARVNRATLFTTGDSLAWIMAIKKGIPCCVFTHGHEAHVWYDYRGNPEAAAAAAAAFKVQRAEMTALRKIANRVLCDSVHRALVDTRSAFEANRQQWIDEWSSAAKLVPAAQEPTDLHKWVTALKIARDRVSEMSVDNRRKLLTDAFAVLTTGVVDDDEEEGAAAAAGGGGGGAAAATGDKKGVILKQALAAGEYKPRVGVSVRNIQDINVAIARMTGVISQPRPTERGVAHALFTSQIQEAVRDYRDPQFEYQALIGIVLALLQKAGSGSRSATALLESVGALFPAGAAAAAAAAAGGGGAERLAGAKRGRGGELAPAGGGGAAAAAGGGGGAAAAGGGGAPAAKRTRPATRSGGGGGAAAAGGGGDTDVDEDMAAGGGGGGGRLQRGRGLDIRETTCDSITTFLTRLLRYNIYLRSRTPEGVATIINLADIVESLESLNARIASEGITLSDDVDTPLLRFPAGTIRRDLFLTLLQSIFGDGETSGDTASWSLVQFILDYFLRDNHYDENDPVVQIVGKLTEETLVAYEERLTALIDKALAGEDAPSGDLVELITGEKAVVTVDMIPLDAQPVTPQFSIPTSEQMAASALRAPASDFTAFLPSEESSALLKRLVEKYSPMPVNSSALAQAPPPKPNVPIMAGGKRKITRKRRRRARNTRRR